MKIGLWEVKHKYFMYTSMSCSAYKKLKLFSLLTFKIFVGYDEVLAFLLLGRLITWMYSKKEQKGKIQVWMRCR